MINIKMKINLVNFYWTGLGFELGALFFDEADIIEMEVLLLQRLKITSWLRTKTKKIP